MRKYVLTIPKDEHGQPKQLFKINFENNVSKRSTSYQVSARVFWQTGLLPIPRRSFSLNMFGSSPRTNRFGHLLMFLRVLSAFLPMASATTKNGKNLDMLWRLCAVMQNNAAQARPILRRFLLIRRFPIRSIGNASYDPDFATRALA